mmetsp:Transcript_28669/g.39601  ORF Transcript_28669/g.39601 Transcript_28669/m.39601 type:complete len:332 (-) Transcript_28669:156-1151(-)|eukprot:CAMPEP_0196588694 /NCGR_PEP_ID=MMETSP1081-20130531/61398_1 /TAXON_ID=36882 /ORGANISM="Pyramimonas amylifera, Strain CCMP720" /LENGTH=331 /DNA_ID=CAMNT_0041911275 /DNA_START=156 /DNA_END=1151 /DNA_ORIENTATION=-
MFTTVNKYVGVVVDVMLGRFFCRHVGPLQGVGSTSLQGKVFLITGPTSGIGKDTAKELVCRGAHVILACRNTEAGKLLAEEWVLDAKLQHGPLSQASFEVVQLDLSSLQSVRDCAQKMSERSMSLDVLIGNAGIFSMGTAPRATTKDGFEAHFGCNYLGHFLLTLLLLPCLKRSAEGGRVVMVSSKLHEFGSFNWSDLQLEKGYSALRAYGQSKLAQVMFCYELQRRSGVRSVSVHPGNVLTDVVRTLPGAVQWLYRLTMQSILLTSSEGARASIHCATAPLADLPGSYFEPTLRAARSARCSYDKCLLVQLWNESLQLVKFPKNVFPSDS